MIKIILFISAIILAYIIVYTAVYFAVGDAVKVAIDNYYNTNDFNPTII